MRPKAIEVGLCPRIGSKARRVTSRAARELGISANALATALHVPANRITGILNETRALTPETALRLKRYFAGTTAQFWLNLQTAFDRRRAESRQREAYALSARESEGRVEKLRTRARG